MSILMSATASPTLFMSSDDNGAWLPYFQHPPVIGWERVEVPILPWNSGFGEAGGPGGCVPNHALFGAEMQRRARCPGRWHGPAAARSVMMAVGLQRAWCRCGRWGSQSGTQASWPWLPCCLAGWKWRLMHCD